MSPLRQLFALLVLWFGLVPTGAAADPISILVTIAVSAATTFGIPMLGIAGGAIAGFGLLGSFLIRAGIGLALSAFSSSLKPKISTATSQSALSSRGYVVTQSGSVLDHQIIYGRVKTGGIRIYDTTTGTNNKYFHRAIGFAAHECDAIETIYLNNMVLTIGGDGFVTAPAQYAGKVFVSKNLGSPTQVADSHMIANIPGWTAAHRLQGICYIYIRLEFDADVFPTGIPSFSAIIRGKKLYDPRSGLTQWSDNPALAIRDYWSDTGYGLGESSANIDDTLVQTAANVCDSASAIDGATMFTCNGAWTTAATPKEMHRALGTAMAGMTWYAQGKWRMKAGSWTTPVATFDENDLRSQLSVKPRHSRRDNFNTIHGTWRGDASLWQVTDFWPVTNAAYLLADNGIESVADLELNFTDTWAEARRLALIALEENRQQMTVSATFGLKAFQVQIGDNIYMNNTRMGWTNKEFQVVNWVFSLTEEMDLVVQMTLRETSANVYNEYNDGHVFESDNTTLLDPFEVPSVGISAVAINRLVNEKLSNVIQVTITSANTPQVDMVELQFKKSSDSVWTTYGTGDLGTFDVVDLDATLYDFRARARNSFGVWASTWDATSNVDSVVVRPPPSDVTDLRGDLMGGVIALNWSPSTDQDLSYYLIRHALEEAGATFANAVTVVDKVPRPATSTVIPAQPGTYFVRPVNKQGNQSSVATSIVIPASALQVFTNVDTQVEHAAFSGTKTGTSVTANELHITDDTSAPSSGEYEFSTYIDTGAVRTARCRVDLKVNRSSSGSGLFDDLVGNIDAMAGLWDDLTGFTQVNDTNVITYIAATDDDPSGSPSWSAWQPFIAGDFNGRAFKFKVKLDSSSDNVTPSITELTARVEYN